MTDSADHPNPDRPTVTVLRNDADSGPGRLPAWADAEGVRTDLVRADAGDPLPAAQDLDGLVMLGGGFLPDDDERAPWLPAERALVADCLREGVPVLGICLGAQLLALVGGGEVRGEHGLPEKGVTALTALSAASEDPLLAGIAADGGGFVGIESHRDQVTRLPEGATLLVRSERCAHQAFRLGRCAWATQWHPEANADNVGRWSPEGLRELGFDKAVLLEQAQQQSDALESNGQRLYARFLDQVRARRADRNGDL